MKTRPSIFLVREGSVLLMRYRYDDATVWGIPGGGVNINETLIDALRRELDEELGVQVDIGELVCVAETPNAGNVKHTLHCIFEGRVAGGEPKINPKNTSAQDVQWVGADEVDDIVLYPPVNDVVKRVLDGDLSARYIGLRERTWY